MTARMARAGDTAGGDNFPARDEGLKTSRRPGVI